MRGNRRPDVGAQLRVAQERRRDPLLRALTILLVLLLFAVAPLHADGVLYVKAYGVATALGSPRWSASFLRDRFPEFGWSRQRTHLF